MGVPARVRASSSSAVGYRPSFLGFTLSWAINAFLVSGFHFIASGSDLLDLFCFGGDMSASEQSTCVQAHPFRLMRSINPNNAIFLMLFVCVKVLVICFLIDWGWGSYEGCVVLRSWTKKGRGAGLSQRTGFDMVHSREARITITTNLLKNTRAPKHTNRVHVHPIKPYTGAG